MQFIHTNVIHRTFTRKYYLELTPTDSISYESDSVIGEGGTELVTRAADHEREYTHSVQIVNMAKLNHSIPFPSHSSSPPLPPLISSMMLLLVCLRQTLSPISCMTAIGHDNMISPTVKFYTMGFIALGESNETTKLST